MKKALLLIIITLCFSSTIYSSDNVLNKAFPTIKGLSLSNNEVIFPKALNGRVAVLSVAFISNLP